MALADGDNSGWGCGETIGLVTYACALCGAVAEGDALPLTWATSVENGRSLVYCDVCARNNVRGIEGRLDSAWW